MVTVSFHNSRTPKIGSINWICNLCYSVFSFNSKKISICVLMYIYNIYKNNISSLIILLLLRCLHRTEKTNLRNSFCFWDMWRVVMVKDKVKWLITDDRAPQSKSIVYGGYWAYSVSPDRYDFQTVFPNSTDGRIYRTWFLDVFRSL